jgi:hypothetical protein
VERVNLEYLQNKDIWNSYIYLRYIRRKWNINDKIQSKEQSSQMYKFNFPSAKYCQNCEALAKRQN